MYKNFLAVIMAVVIALFSVGAVEACTGADCSVKVEGIEISYDQYGNIGGQAFEGVSEVKGCNTDGLYESTKLNIIGSSAGGNMGNSLSIIETNGGVCAAGPCGTTFLVGGTANQFVGGIVHVEGKVNVGNGSSAGYSGTGVYVGTTNTVWGASNIPALLP